MTKFGRPPVLGVHLKERLENAGFVGVQMLRFKQPMGPWPKDKRLKCGIEVAYLSNTNAVTGQSGL
jgi:hypothetical protein